jgi:serine/threonine protein kinase
MILSKDLMNPTFADLPEDQLLRINALCNRFEAAWRAERRIRIEEVLKDSSPKDLPAATRELVQLEVDYRRRAGETPTLAEYQTRFPTLDPRWLKSLVADQPAVSEERVATQQVSSDKRSTAVRQLGDYRLLERLGGGGMGTVYKAVHERMGRTVALKVLRPELQRDPKLMQRFDREVKTAASLIHPNIVTAFDAREYKGVRFLITELVDGIDLDRLVRKKGVCTVDMAIDIIRQAAQGLQYAHQRGVIHRDIKPANLLLDRTGVVKVLDMGLARLETPDEKDEGLTESGLVMGTAAYMAPEQARNTRRADARSDIYSLGCTLYFLLNGRAVYSGETVIDTIMAHTSEPIPCLGRDRSDIPPALERVFVRMVAKNPEERFQSADELLTALEELTEGNPPDPHEPSLQALFTTVAAVDSSPRRSRPPQSRKTTATVITAIVVVVGMALVVMLGPPAPAPNPQPDPGPSEPPVTAGGSGTSAEPRELTIVPDDRAADRMNSTGSTPAGLRFNGVNSFVVIRDLLPERGASYTLEAVARVRQFRTSNVISWLGPDWMAMYLDNSGRWGLARRWNSSSVLVAATRPSAINETTHVAGVFDGETLTLFVNGEKVELAPVAFSLSDATGGLFVGGVERDRLPPDQSDRFFDGSIESIRISRGVRYRRSFAVSLPLTVDDQTLALLPLNPSTDQITNKAQLRLPGNLRVERVNVDANNP